MKTWIKNPEAVWTGNADDASGGIVVEESKIIELVSSGTPLNQFDETLDASDCVLLPGLVNCHHHFFQTLTRAFPAALNKELFDWLVSLYPVWSNLTESAIESSSRAAMCELMLSGCTTTADHHYVFSDNTTGAIDIQARVAQELGMRATLTRGSMSLGVEDGGLPPNTLVQADDVILTHSQRVIDTWHDTKDGAMVQIAIAPCSPFSVSTGLMRDSAILARSNQVRLHTHLAETLDEDEFCIEKYGVRPLEYLEQVEWLADDVWLAHGIHFTETEITRLGNAGVGICHCPSSNMILASGLCPVRDLVEAGSAVGLGVDGSASNDASNMMQEVRQAFLMQRLRYGSAAVSHEDALTWATRGGAALLGRTDIGEIAVGMEADIALFDLGDLRFAGSGDPVAALVLSGAHQARDVMVAGQWKVNKGELVDIDLDQVRANQVSEAKILAGSL